MSSSRAFQNTEIMDWGTCPTCGKIMYPSKKRAKQAARARYPGDHLSAYRCGEMWHIGHLPRAVVRGADRSTILPGPKRERKKFKS